MSTSMTYMGTVEHVDLGGGYFILHSVDADKTSYRLAFAYSNHQLYSHLLVSSQTASMVELVASEQDKDVLVTGGNNLPLLLVASVR